MSDIIKKKQQKQTSVLSTVFTIAHRVVPLVIFVIGCFAATQYFAHHVDGNQHLNGVMLRNATSGETIYFPWMVFLWWYQYGVSTASTPPELQHALDLLLVYTIAAVILFIILSFGRLLRGRATNLHGTAGIATDNELKEMGLFSDGGVILGQTAKADVRTNERGGELRFDLKRESPFVSHGGQTSTAVIGGTRNGKGVSVVIPTLLSFPGSVIVFDPKTENYEKTAGHRRKFSHTILFAPASRTTARLNPLLGIRPGAFAMRDASIVADAIVQGTSTGEGKDESAQYFQQQARRLLVLSILHVLASDRYKKKSLTTVYKMLSDNVKTQEGQDRLDVILNSMISTNHSDPIIHEQIVAWASQYLSTPEKERGSIFSTLYSKLEVYLDPIVENATTENDLYFEDFMESEHPISLYLAFPWSDVDRLAPLCRLIISYYIRRIAEGSTSHTKKRLKTPLLFVLDEFPLLGRFEFLEQAMGILAGYGATFLLAAQNKKQLTRIYGDHTNILDHCRVIAYMTPAPDDIEGARHISEILGKESVYHQNLSASSQPMSMAPSNMTVAGQEVSRSVLNADEFMVLPKSDLIVLAQGMRPYIAKKAVYFSDTRLKDLAGLPVPDTIASILEEVPPHDHDGDLHGWIPKYDSESDEALELANAMISTSSEYNPNIQKQFLESIEEQLQAPQPSTTPERHSNRGII